MGKYRPLENHLLSMGHQRWRVGFAEIETILGFPLPPSAFRYPAWWANDAKGHSHAAAWLDAGWRTEDVDIAGRKVTLIRVLPTPQGQRHGCMRGTGWLAPGFDAARPLEDPVLAEQGAALSE